MGAEMEQSQNLCAMTNWTFIHEILWAKGNSFTSLYLNTSIRETGLGDMSLKAIRVTEVLCTQVTELEAQSLFQLEQTDMEKYLEGHPTWKTSDLWSIHI